MLSVKEVKRNSGIAEGSLLEATPAFYPDWLCGFQKRLQSYPAVVLGMKSSITDKKQRCAE